MFQLTELAQAELLKLSRNCLETHLKTGQRQIECPSLPELLEALFGGLGVRAPNNFPRSDLVAVFLTGIPGLTKPAMLSRLSR